MILAILNQKGGAGKTVLSTNLAVAFQKSGARVLLVDSDFQGSSLLWRALSPDEYPRVVHATTPGAIGEAVRVSLAPVTIIPVLPTRVAKRVAYREAVSPGLGVLDLAKARTAAEEILSLANDILEL